MYDMGLDWPNMGCIYYLFMNQVRYVLRPKIVVCSQDVKQPT